MVSHDLRMAFLNVIRFTFDETDNCLLLCQMNNRTKRNEYCAKGKGYYHFCTDGLKDGQLFYTAEQFAFGMILMGILTIKFDVKIYAFVLMPNHIHIILSATGENCVKAFDYLRFKISMRLKADGYDPLPEDYDFVLQAIMDRDHMSGEIVYVLRNPYEKNFAAISGYIWGSGWIYHSTLPDYITGERAETMSARKLQKLTTIKEQVPSHWVFHQKIGLLPASFVDYSKVEQLFPTAKDYESALVKDYESYVRTARALNETLEWSTSEIKAIVNKELQQSFGGESLRSLSLDNKYKLAVQLNHKYDLTAQQISQSIYLPERIVLQVLSSKDYRSPRR